MNKVYLIGNVTKNLELKYFGIENRPFVQFSLAVNNYSTSKKETITDFINIVAFGKKAEVLSKYIYKGSRISVEGKLTTSNYIDTNNVKKYSIDIVLENFDFLDSIKSIV